LSLADVHISTGIRASLHGEVDRLIRYALASIAEVDAPVEVHVTARHPRRFHVLLTDPLPRAAHPRCRLLPYTGGVGAGFRAPLGLPDPAPEVPRRFAAVTDRDKAVLEREAARHGGELRTWTAPAVDFTGRAWPPAALRPRQPARPLGRSGGTHRGRPRPRVAPGVRHLITLRIPAHPDRVAGYPRTLVYKKAVPIHVTSWREQLVALAAHEARHVWQHHTGGPGGEVDAERWALRVLAAWRDTHPRPSG
jgi:hypothetical protein